MAGRYLWIVVLALAAVLVSGCNKDNGTGLESSAALSNNDAADAFALALGGSQASGGFTAQLEESTTMAGSSLMSKTDAFGNAQFDTTVTRTHTGLCSYAYAFHFAINLVNASRIDFAYTMKGTYDVPRMSSSDSASATFQISNLMSGNAYAVSGIYNRYGSQTSKVREKNSWTSVITISMTGLSVDKSTMKITAGTATLTIYGKTSTGSVYAVNGKLTFIGNDGAILVIGTNTYTVNLAAGEATLAG